MLGEIEYHFEKIFENWDLLKQLAQSPFTVYLNVMEIKKTNGFSL